MIRKTILVVSLSAFSYACGGAALPAPEAGGDHHAHPELAPPAAKSGVKAPGDANVGDTTTCPVSGEEFTVEATSQKVEHDGKTYYFCCGGCKKKFESEPAKFIKKS